MDTDRAVGIADRLGDDRDRGERQRAEMMRDVVS
jgi:hypothetical protein